MLSSRQLKVKGEYNSKGLDSQEVNFVDQEKPTFSAMCCLENENLMFAASSSLKSIISMSVHFDGYGVQGVILAEIPYETAWVIIRSMCLFQDQLFFVAVDGIFNVWIQNHSCTQILDNNKADLNPYQIRATDSCVVFSDPSTRKIYSYNSVDCRIEVFAGTGEEKSVDGPVDTCCFEQPCGLAVEFGAVVYVTDAMAASVLVVTTIKKTVEFLQTVGNLYKVFSVHGKGKKFTTYTLAEALILIKPSLKFLEENQALIRNTVKTKLPKALNGPEGNVAAKTIGSVALVQWGVERLLNVTSRYHYVSTSLLSCMTLDVEHFHATTHFKMPVMSKLEYARSFGSCMKENCKRMSKWSVHYFTKDTSWYLLPEGSINFKDMPVMKPLPCVNLPQNEIKKLVDFASAYGRCVRQLSNRQTTTKAKAGTLPHSCYNNNYQGEKTILVASELNESSKSTQDDKDDEDNEVEVEVEVEDEDEHQDEFSDSDGEDDADGHGNEVIHDDLEPLSRDATFLVGHTSRFGRAIRFNSKFLL